MELEHDGCGGTYVAKEDSDPFLVWFQCNKCGYWILEVVD